MTPNEFGPPESAAAEPIRDRLRTALRTAMRARDRAVVSAIRATLGAIDNAESEGIPAGRAGAIESAELGVGAAEARRRALTETEMAALVDAEIADLDSAAATHERAGARDRAAELRRGAAGLRALR
ncbi:hypothetical protein ACWDPV_18105 [Gordonia sp. NPDC003504]